MNIFIRNNEGTTKHPSSFDLEESCDIFNSYQSKKIDIFQFMDALHSWGEIEILLPQERPFVSDNDNNMASSRTQESTMIFRPSTIEINRINKFYE